MSGILTNAPLVRRAAVTVDTGSLQTIAWATQTSPENPTSYVGVPNVRWPASMGLVWIAPVRWVYVQSHVLLTVSVAANGVVSLYGVDLAGGHVRE
jgi:hypothetical protein